MKALDLIFKQNEVNHLAKRNILKCCADPSFPTRDLTIVLNTEWLSCLASEVRVSFSFFSVDQSFLNFDICKKAIPQSTYPFYLLTEDSRLCLNSNSPVPLC